MDCVVKSADSAPVHLSGMKAALVSYSGPPAGWGTAPVLLLHPNPLIVQ